MGIRFHCPHCQGKLHVKRFLAGRRGICPHCQGSLQIPDVNDEPSTELLWYVRPPDGGEYGPAETPLMEAWLAEGRIGATALVWRTGWSEWQEASSVFPKLAAPERAPVAGDRAAAPPSPPPPPFPPAFANTPLPSPKHSTAQVGNPPVRPVLPDDSVGSAGVQSHEGGSEPNGSVPGGGSIRPDPAPTLQTPPVASPRQLPPPEMAGLKSAPAARSVPAARAEGRYRRRRGDRKGWWVTAVIFLGLTAAALLVTLLVVLMNQTAG